MRWMLCSCRSVDRKMGPIRLEKAMTFVSLMAWGVAGACATTGTSTVSDSQWREELGRVTQSALETSLEKIFRKHGVVVRRTQAEVGDRDLRFETEWVARTVLAVEEAIGVTGARNRIVITASRIGDGESAGSAVLYRTRWHVENQATAVANPEWHAAPIPDEVAENYRSVFSDLEMEIRTSNR